MAFDAVDAPAQVHHVTSSGSAFATSGLNSAYASSREESFVCATPCVVNLPYGEYRMRFTQKSGSSSPWREYWADVRVGPEPKVVRVDMNDTYEQSSGAGFGSLALMVLGGATAMTGGGLAAAEIEGGAAVGLVGAAALIGGIILMVATQTEVFPGAETQWAPADQRIFTR